MGDAIENQSDTFEIGEFTIHRLGFGAMRLTGPNIIGPPDDEETARRVVRQAVDLGVDFVDTADSYGPGVSERLLGETLDEDEDDVLVATKAGLVREQTGKWHAHGYSEYIRNQVLCSLDRLRTDRIDLYQFHRPDPEVPFEDSVETFAELKDEGLVGHVGLCNVSVEQLETAREIVEIATVQNRYNVGYREHEPVLDACEAAGIGFMPWYPLGGGDLREKVTALDAIAAAHDATRRQIALAWLLQHSPVTLPIPGTSSVEHVAENVAASAIELTDDEMARLNG